MDNTSARLYTERKGAVEGEDTEFRAGEMGRSRMGLELEWSFWGEKRPTLSLQTG